MKFSVTFLMKNSNFLNWHENYLVPNAYFLFSSRKKYKVLLYRPSPFLLLLVAAIFVLSSGCSTKIAERGETFSVDESLTEEGLFERSIFCRIMDKKQKENDKIIANNYCQQFGKVAKVLSQNSIRQDVFAPNNVRIKIGEICTTSFSCV